MEIWEVEEGQTPIEGLLDDGSPDPSYAAALGLVQAPLDRRAKAFAVECAIYLVLQVPMWILMVPLLLKFLTGRISGYGFVNHPDFKLAAILAGVTVVLTLGYSIAQLALHGSKGVTLGKALFGIRSVNVRTLEKPGLGKVFLRAIVVWGASVVPFGSVVVLASPLFKSAERGRGWQDKVGQNWLIDIRNGLDPYDEKRMRIARKTQAAAPRAERSELPSLTDAPGRSGGAFYQPGSRLSAGVLGRAEQATAGGALATPAGASSSTPAPPTRPALVTPPPAPTPAPQAPARPVTPPAPPAAPVPAAPVAPPAPPAPPAPAPAPVFVLHVDTGEQIRVEGAVIIGRSPTPPAGIEAHPVVIIDELLSRTHLLVRQVDGGLELTDCGSSNGTAVTHQGVTRQLVAQQPSQAGPDDTIQIGQRTATVRRA